MPLPRLALSVLLTLAACQTYEFQPAPPLAWEVALAHEDLAATAPKPNLFFLVDKSGSMTLSADPSCGANCTSRWQALTSAMEKFASSSGTVAHTGMLAFPKAPMSDACQPPDMGDLDSLGVALDGSAVDDDAALQQKTDEVLGKIREITPRGGTPTAFSVRALAQYTPLVRPAYHRASFVVLMTDGLPNCNPQHNGESASCYCTNTRDQGSCRTPIGAPPNNQCLDGSGTAAEIAFLREHYGVRTIVVGFGTDVTGSVGQTTLEAMARAGGFQRRCQSDADCGVADTCAPGGTDACGRAITACTKSFYQAANASELGDALSKIRDQISCDPCSRALPATPKDARLVSVIIDGTPVLPGPDTWSVVGSNVVFVANGNICQRIRATTLLEPLKAEFRVANPLE
ncbi:MAG: adventurous gliding motility lipoprotein CglB [Myxococcaceae bacterium]|nr:adventurous gliding motility lipoprotein CglB [Myxococcaceae bacterium]